MLGYNESVYTAHTGSTNRLSIKKDTHKLKLCIHRKSAATRDSKKVIDESNLFMVNNHKETTSDVEPKKSYEKSHKLKMSAFP